MPDNEDQTPVCRYCNANNPANNRYCGSCGVLIDPVSATIENYLQSHLDERLDSIIKNRFGGQQFSELSIAAMAAERLVGWGKLIALAIALPLTLIGGYLTMLGFDYRTSLETAKSDLIRLSESSKNQLSDFQEKIKENKKVADDFERQASILNGKMQNANAVIDQVEKLTKKVDHLEDQVEGRGAMSFKSLKSQGKALGIDVSHHDGNIDWKAVKASGVEFVYLKATQGTQYYDPNFRDNWDQAKDAGLLRGAYHVLFGDNIEEQAASFTKIVNQSEAELPPAVDFENYPFGKTPTLDNLRLFLKLLEKQTGCTPIIYSGQFLKKLLGQNDNTLLKNYPLWVAQYGPSPTTPNGFDNWSFWQFSDSLKVKNLPFSDFNAFNGSGMELRTMTEKLCHRN